VSEASLLSPPGNIPGNERGDIGRHRELSAV
jgi:hypothetical protein